MVKKINLVLSQIKGTLAKHKAQGDIDLITEDLLYGNIRIDLINSEVLK